MSEHSFRLVAEVSLARLGGKEFDALIGGEDAVLKRGDELFGGCLVGLAVVIACKPLCGCCLDVVGRPDGGELFYLALELFADGLLTEVDTETVLGVVLKEGVRPRGTSACLAVDGVRSRRRGAAPDGGASGRVGNIHSLAEELCYESRIGGLGAARAGAGELKQRLLELAALDGGVDKLGLFGDVRHGVVERGLLVELSGLKDHFDRALCGGELCALLGSGLGIVLGMLGSDRLCGVFKRFLCNGASLYTERAAHAVHRAYRHGEFVVGLYDRLCGELRRCGRGGAFLFGHCKGTDRCMRANERAVVALDAVFGLPCGNVDRNAALFICGSALRICTVGAVLECGNGERISAHGINGLNDAVDEIDKILAVAGGFGLGRVGSAVCPRCGNVYLHHRIRSGVDGGIVEVNYRLSLLDVGLVCHLLHVLNGFILGKDAGEREECGLENGVLYLCVADALYGDTGTVDDIEVDVVLGKIFLDGGGQVSVKLLGLPCAVKQECAARLYILYHVVLIEVCVVVAGNKVCLGDVVGALYGVVTEAQVRNGDTAGLL